MRSWPVLLCFVVACGPPKWIAPATSAVSQVSTLRKDYFKGPWPDDRRLDGGKIPTLNFPNPGEGSLAVNLFETADKLVDGWGLSAPMYLPMSGPLAEDSLPDSPAASALASSSLYVVAIDPKSPHYGKRTPIEWDFFEDATSYLPANTLALRPVMGVPLKEKTTYAIIATTAIKDRNGHALGADEPMWDVLVGAKKDAHYAALLAYLDKEKIERTSVAVAVLFHTQTVLDELQLLYAYLQSLPAPTIDNVVLTRQNASSYTFHADYAAPYLVHGDAPYQMQGGEFLYDDQGAPIVNKVERMRLSIVVPKSAMPGGGYPVVMYSHGTGGSFDDVGRDIGYDLAKIGIASVGIDQVLHGPRVPAGSTCFANSADICFFNPVNAKAGRNLVRQAALDHVLLKKLLETQSFTAAPLTTAVSFDAARVGYFGHSQGGLSGALYVAVEHDLQGVVLSGTGGHLMTTVLLRTDPIDLRELAEGPLFLNLSNGEHIGPFHPALAILQTLGEAADPLNYGPHWLFDEGGGVKNLYMTSGLDDPYTPAIGAAALAADSGLPQWTDGSTASPAAELLGLGKVSGPLSANLTTPSGTTTAVFRQFPNEGHFPVFDTPAIDQWTEMFATGFATGTATIP